MHRANRVIVLRYLCAFFCGGLFSFSAPTPLTLRDEKFPFTPNHYFIANVVDQRTDRRSVAQLITTPGQPAEPVDLSGGAAAAVNRFAQAGFRQNPKLRPITIRIRELALTETAVGTRRVDGRLSMVLIFNVMREDDSFELVTFRTSARYQRPSGQLDAVEPTLRQALVNGLVFFNDWVNRNVSQHEKLATRLQVNITNYVRNPDRDTVFYDPARPLVWSDFLAPVPRSRYAAQVFTSFAYEGHSEVKNGVIQVNLTFKIYTLKNSSWVSEPARNAYALNHEQRHFEITKLVTERFKKRIIADSLSLNDYNSEIQYQYIEAFREMNRLQDQYDGEANHGIIQPAQERWNQRLDAELRSFGLK